MLPGIEAQYQYQEGFNKYKTTRMKCGNIHRNSLDFYIYPKQCLFFFSVHLPWLLTN